MRRYAPVLALFLLAPFIGEVLFGATPLSRVQLFFAQIGMYGGGAILIRELVRHRGLSAGWLVLLGLAYGIVEEGFVLQSLFNPRYPGLGILGSYGRAVGVNWVWAEFILGYHAIFSVTIPVMLTELIFPERRKDPWLRNRVWMAILALFTANCFALRLFLKGWSGSRQTPASPLQLIAAVVLVCAIVVFALRARPTSFGKHHDVGISSPVRTSTLRFVGFSGALAWFAVRILVVGDGHRMTPGVALGLWTVVAVLVWFAVQRAFASCRRRPRMGVYTLIAGALPISWLFGVLIVSVSSRAPALDLLGHLLFGSGALVGLRAIRSRQWSDL